MIEAPVELLRVTEYPEVGWSIPTATLNLDNKKGSPPLVEETFHARRFDSQRGIKVSVQDKPLFVIAREARVRHRFRMLPWKIAKRGLHWTVEWPVRSMAWIP